MPSSHVPQLACVALTYQRNRLCKAGLAAEILDLAADAGQSEALVFDTSTPAAIDGARTLSPRFDTMMRRLEKEFGISLEWPGFDILSLDPRLEKVPDRLVHSFREAEHLAVSVVRL